jgi:CheY-like chemotaxis protein
MMNGDKINQDKKEKKNILVVEDDKTMQTLISVLLRNEYNVTSKNDGMEALDYLNKGNYPDLILLDMEMPNMNGRVFVRRIKSDTRYLNIPIVFVTLINNKLITATFKKMGVVDFIFKPFHAEELINKVHDILKSEN